jgi:hypothetical protein
MTLSGRAAFDSASPPSNPSSMRVSLTPLLSGNAVAMVIAPVALDAQGNFTFTNVAPGRYRLSSAGPVTASTPNAPPGPPAAAAGWALKSAQVHGQETLDTGLEVRPNENIADLVLTFSDKSTTVTGVLQDPSGRQASDYFIVAYAREKNFWSPPSRRVAMARPGTDGRFTIRNLPAGDYLVAAVTDVDQGEWMDPAFLAQLVNASIPLTLADGQIKTQDIRIAGR